MATKKDEGPKFTAEIQVVLLVSVPLVSRDWPTALTEAGQFGLGKLLTLKPGVENIDYRVEKAAVRDDTVNAL